MKARWPATGTVDDTLIRAFEYLIQAAHTFRLRLKDWLVRNSKTSKDKAGDKTADAAKKSKPTHATIYVAKKFPLWQDIVMQTLARMYAASAPDEPANKDIASELGKIAELKKYQKKVMSFVADRKAAFAQHGSSAFEQAVLFDEVAVLRENIDYLRNTLELDGVEIGYSDQCELAHIQEECCPGQPNIIYRVESAAEQ